MPDAGKERNKLKATFLANSDNPSMELLEIDPARENYCIPYSTNYVMTNPDSNLDYRYVGDRGYKITSVAIPSTVTYIDNLAFAKTGLLSVNLNALNDLIYIGDTSFIFTNLSSIDLSGLPKLQTIGFYAFSKSGVESVDLTNISNLKEIRSGAFDYNQISTINFTGSNNIIHIGSEAFSRNQINNIIINNLTNLSSLGYGAFCENPFESNHNYPQVSNLTNIDDPQLGYACLLEAS